MTIKRNIILIALFIFVVLTLFINKLTTPRTLSTNELLVNGLFLFDNPKFYALLEELEFRTLLNRLHKKRAAGSKKQEEVNLREDENNKEKGEFVAESEGEWNTQYILLICSGFSTEMNILIQLIQLWQTENTQG